MLLSIIIPTKEREDILFLTLENVCRAVKNIETEIIVVNDSKKSSPHLGENYSAIKLLQNPKSGVASARNIGASVAQAELLIFLDDDMLVSEENISTAIELIEKFPAAAINLNWTYPAELLNKIKVTSFGRYLIKNGFTALKGWNKNSYWNDVSIFESKGITSQFLIIKKSDFLKSNGYNEHFPFAGFEDYDFNQRLKRSGLKTYIYPLSTALHNEVDRINPGPWMERKVRTGVTRRKAVEQGYPELKISHNKLKHLTYILLVRCKPVLFFLAGMIPNHPTFDFVYFRLTNLLLGTSLFEGYHKKVH